VGLAFANVQYAEVYVGEWANRNGITLDALVAIDAGDSLVFHVVNATFGVEVNGINCFAAVAITKVPFVVNKSGEDFGFVYKLYRIALVTLERVKSGSGRGAT